MKKSSIWKLLFSALTVFAVAVFAGCTDDNDDMGAPYLNVTPENLTFDAEGSGVLSCGISLDTSNQCL